MCIVVCCVCVQYSFDERQPQGQGSAGRNGSEDAADMDDSFSKQVTLLSSPNPPQKEEDRREARVNVGVGKDRAPVGKNPRTSVCPSPAQSSVFFTCAASTQPCGSC